MLYALNCGEQRWRFTIVFFLFVINVSLEELWTLIASCWLGDRLGDVKDQLWKEELRLPKVLMLCTISLGYYVALKSPMNENNTQWFCERF